MSARPTSVRRTFGRDSASACIGVTKMSPLCRTSMLSAFTSVCAQLCPSFLQEQFGTKVFWNLKAFGSEA
ncbi:hypothetical protein LDDCCGHA_4870 [Methylobacterium oxalidis]|nr:hypothetical protein LDDCCGHA_4870 [Methylobacterium oxalidis]